MSDHPATPARRLVRAGFALTVCLVAAAVRIGADGRPATAAALALDAAALVIGLAVLCVGVHLDVVQPRRTRRRARARTGRGPRGPDGTGSSADPGRDH